MSHDPIMNIALTPRKQSPELAAMEWAEDNKHYARMLVTVVSVFAFITIVLVAIQ